MAARPPPQLTEASARAVRGEQTLALKQPSQREDAPRQAAADQTGEAAPLQQGARVVNQRVGHTADGDRL